MALINQKLKMLVLGEAQIDLRFQEVAFHSIRHRRNPLQDVTDRLTKSRRTLGHRLIFEYRFEVVVETFIGIGLRRIPLLSPDEVQTLIRTPHHLKHRLILATLYTTGLRASELCRLQGTDIDSGRIVVIMHQGKSKKDRQVPLSPDLLPQLRGY